MKQLSTWNPSSHLSGRSYSVSSSYNAYIVHTQSSVNCILDSQAIDTAKHTSLFPVENTLLCSNTPLCAPISHDLPVSSELSGAHISDLSSL